MDNRPFSCCSSPGSYPHHIVTIIKGIIFAPVNILWETLMGNILPNIWLVASFSLWTIRLKRFVADKVAWRQIFFFPPSSLIFHSHSSFQQSILTDIFIIIRN
jgi:hypothetical protein